MNQTNVNISDIPIHFKENIFSWSMYWIAISPSNLFIKLKIKPNTITLFSVLLCLIGMTLWSNSIVTISSLFLILSQILDHCDGMVARKTGIINSSSYNIDHLADVSRFFILGFFIIFSISVNNVFSASFLLLFFYFFLHSILDSTKYKTISGTYKIKKNLILNFFFNNFIAISPTTYLYIVLALIVNEFNMIFINIFFISTLYNCVSTLKRLIIFK